MLLVGEDPRKFINDYSNQFKRDFLQLLKTAHGEKKVHMNNFYQEYIKDKEHVHMNSTKWPSLTEFAKYLGREGVCRVEEGDKGLEIQWIDDSAQAIARKEDIKRKERMAKGDEDMESRLLEQQIRKAREAAEKAGRIETPPPRELADGDTAGPIKMSFSLGARAAPKQQSPPKEQSADVTVQIESYSATDQVSRPGPTPQKQESAGDEDEETEEARPEAPKPEAKPKMSLSLGGKAKPSNPLMKRNPLAKKKDTAVAAPEKKMSNAERIMKEEMERKRLAEQRGYGGNKRPRLA